mmetsp:Transcript_28331/g.72586  ORF Transcript_28331/g.72586 Transcript_28331/m.72586 type:complete len:295 (-) Transcript_28331:231-1115(-)
MLRRLLAPSSAIAGAAAAACLAQNARPTLAKEQPPLAGRSAIVTGSTSGIGLAIAESLAAHGCNVVLNGFGDEITIRQLEFDLSQRYGVVVTHIAADVTQSEQVRSMVAEAEARLGAVDILVNNAGIQHVSPIEEFPEEQWDRVLAVNLTSAFHTTKACLPGMVDRGFGRVINIASAHGRVGSANKSAYVAAKHGVLGLTKVTALETAGSGVTANTICPGWVLTPLVRKQVEMRASKSGRTVEEETRVLVSEKHPSGRAVDPSHLGALVVFLCSDAACQITGADLSVDGGWTAQ